MMTKEERREYNKKWWADHPEKRKQYAISGRESHNKASKKYRDEHPELYEQYKIDHAEELREYWRARQFHFKCVAYFYRMKLCDFKKLPLEDRHELIACYEIDHDLHYLV